MDNNTISQSSADGMGNVYDVLKHIIIYQPFQKLNQTPFSIHFIGVFISFSLFIIYGFWTFADIFIKCVMGTLEMQMLTSLAYIFSQHEMVLCVIFSLII